MSQLVPLVSVTFVHQVNVSFDSRMYNCVTKTQHPIYADYSARIVVIGDTEYPFERVSSMCRDKADPVAKKVAA